MSDASTDGWPAFPTPGFQAKHGYPSPPQPGMSLRDYFAGQAASAYAVQLWESGETENKVWAYEVVAKSAYSLADAMLAERAKKGAAS